MKATKPLKCSMTHKPLPVVLGGETFYLYGGSCYIPQEKEVDIYVDLDSSVHYREAYPWETGKMGIYFPIQDQRAPSNPQGFREMILWLASKVREGKKVFVGCIGGHGRTGTVLSALVSILDPSMEEPITYVRENYCQKAVESKEQIAWLVQHFGCEQVEPVIRFQNKWDTGQRLDSWSFDGKKPSSSYKKPQQQLSLVPANDTLEKRGSGVLVKASPVPFCIWGKS